VAQGVSTFGRAAAGLRHNRDPARERNLQDASTREQGKASLSSNTHEPLTLKRRERRVPTTRREGKLARNSWAIYDFNQVAEFEKYLVLSTESSRLTREEFLLDRVAWKDLGKIQNLCDYDRIVINLTALTEGPVPLFDDLQIDQVFDLKSWMHIVASGGDIFIVGDPAITIRVVETAEGNRRKTLAQSIDCAEPVPVFRSSIPRRMPPLPDGQQINPLQKLLSVEKDLRPLDYRRISRVGEDRFETVYKYLDEVSVWNYSLSRCALADSWKELLEDYCVQCDGSELAATSYATILAAQYTFLGRGFTGSLTLLPSLGEGSDAEDAFILREFFEIAANLPEPDWVQSLLLPGQAEVEKEITTKRDEMVQIERAISEARAQLLACKRWYRLLYDDGNSLEAIVKESFELLGASVIKKSKEKDDYRINLSGFPKSVMEVKGTHNPQFSKGALRQLAGWMDEANALENIVVKGIFLGNSGRNHELQNRGNLFEKNNEHYAIIKDIVIVRSMDLFCLVVLKQLGLLDVAALWKEFYGCKGRLDCSKYWAALPTEYQPLSVPSGKAAR